MGKKKIALLLKLCRSCKQTCFYMAEMGHWGSVDVACVCSAHIHHGFFSMEPESRVISKKYSLCVSVVSYLQQQPTGNLRPQRCIHLTSNTHCNVCVCVWVSNWQRNAGQGNKAGWLIINGCRFTLVTEEQRYCASEMKLSCHLFHIPAAEHHAYGSGEKKKCKLIVLINVIYEP